MENRTTDAAGDVVAPTHDDPVVRGASAGFGGPLGRHAARGSSWWTPIRVLIALAMLSSVLMYMQKLPCRNQPWNGFQYSHACYNDIYPLYFSEGLDKGKVPYLDTHTDSNGNPTNVEYPVLIGGAMWIGMKVVDAVVPSTANDRGQRFLDVTWFMLAIAALVAVVATALTHRRRIWDAAMLALAPSLILAGLINWDLIAVALTSLAMLAWSRKRVFVSGLLFGLAVAAKFYPLLLLAPLFMLCLRGRRLGPFFRMLAGAVVGWAIVDVPVWIAAPSGFGTFYAFNKSRTPDWGSIWYAFQQMFDHSFSIHEVNTYEAALTVIILLGVAALAFGVARRPRVPQLMFLTLALFLVVNKVYSPQYVLWLLPLFVLARPRWRAFLVWQFAEILYFLGIWFYLLEVSRPGKGLEWQPYLVSLWIRDIAVLAMCVLVVIDMVRPSRDVVRMDGSDDPAGGVLDGAPDIFDRSQRYEEPVGAPA
ncbi:MAG TPA: glycosyltransferase 87 family protein [Acidothermaceae bacterium]